jgi:hypothetical protein
MGQFVAMCGSLDEGVTVFGPYPSKIAAERDTEERIRGGWCHASVVDFLPLTRDNPVGEYVLVLGNLKEGFAVYGQYHTAELAANASSPFRPAPINPNTPNGQRQAVILYMSPPFNS